MKCGNPGPCKQAVKREDGFMVLVIRQSRVAALAAKLISISLGSFANMDTCQDEFSQPKSQVKDDEERESMNQWLKKDLMSKKSCQNYQKMQVRNFSTVLKMSNFPII